VILYKGTTLKISPDREYEYVNGNAGTFLVNLVPFLRLHL